MSKRLRKYSVGLSILVVATGILVLLGWQFDIIAFLHPLQGEVPMNPMTAVAFIFSGACLLLLLYRQGNKYLLSISKIIAVLVSLIGLLRLLAVFNFYDAGPDRFLFAGKMAVYLFDNKPISMAPYTAINFLLSGISLLFLSHNKIVVSQWLSLLTAFAALLSIIGYTYGVMSFYDVVSYFPTAVETIACFLLFSTAILFFSSDKGFMAEITGPYQGGKAARVLLLIVIFFPIIMGLLRLYGEKTGLQSTPIGNILFEISFIILCVILIWKTVVSINKSQLALTQEIAERKLLEDKIKLFSLELEIKVDEKTEEVIAKEQQYRFLLENMRESIQVIGHDWRYLFVNNSLAIQSKYSREALLGHTMMEKYPGIENTELFNVLQRCMKNRCQQIAETEFIFPDGSKGWFELSIQPVPEGLFILTMDITERKKAEIQLQAANKELENHIIIVSESEEKLRLTLDAIGDNAWDHHFTTGKTTFSNTVERLLGYSTDEHTDNAALWWQNTFTEDKWMLEDNDKKYKAGEKDRHSLEYRMYHKDGSLKWILDRGVVIEKDKTGKPLRIVGSHTDITARKNAEKDIRQSQEKYFALMNSVDGIVWEADAKTFEFSFVSQQAERLLGYPVEQWINNPSFWADHIYEEDRDWAINYCVKSTKERKPHEFEYRMVASDGKLVWLRDIVSVQVDNSGNVKLSGVMIDITGQKKDELLLKKLNENLEKKSSELEASNTELERFAYIASHDLQEPLRMVSSFMGLLEKRMNGQLDETNKQYIHFAVDGAERMKMLIQALLQYSRIGDNKENFTAIDLNEVMQYTTLLLEKDIQKSQAVVTVKPLPVITANKSLISQLFVNLVSNALKYQGTEEPKIEVGFTEAQSGWIFYVKDNGIGIDNKFFDKIFIIFQRLHNNDEYSGTGIGLAICKKIIGIHNGKIWVKSEPGTGSTFYFSIPKQDA